MTKAIDEISAMKLDDFKAELNDLSKEQLEQLLRLEEAKGDGARKGALEAIAAELDDIEGGETNDDGGEGDEGDQTSNDQGGDQGGEERLEDGETAGLDDPVPDQAQPVRGVGDDVENAKPQTLDATEPGPAIDVGAAEQPVPEPDLTGKPDWDNRTDSQRAIDMTRDGPMFIVLADASGPIDELPAIETSPADWAVQSGRAVYMRALTLRRDGAHHRILGVWLGHPSGRIVAKVELSAPLPAGGGAEAEFPSGSLAF
ncbi:hypothetical protein FHS96_004978 [Sphingomonas zeicaulis]|uniref:hypothetical protein n=1 Tax=Sphingomonas zeicaulis TaxID=1632740 RepID=UPI003D2189C2